MCSVAWEWYGTEEKGSASLKDDPKAFKKNPYNDYVVVKALHNQMSKADIIIGHNSNRFDWKHFQARALLHGLPKIEKPQMIDTLLVSRQNFMFPSHSMDYLCKKFGIQTKQDMPIQVWIDIAMKSCDKAMDKMLEYNEDDVTRQMGMIEKLKPYIPLLNVSYTDVDDPTCDRCGGHDIKWNGWHDTKIASYRRGRCRACYNPIRAVKNESNK